MERAMNIKVKPKAMKARGIRFSDEQWDMITIIAARDKSGRTKPSDVVRHAIEAFLEKEG
jgi:predicted DNA-binding protein